MKNLKKYNFKKIFTNKFVIRIFIYTFFFLTSLSIIITTYYPEMWVFISAIFIRSLLFIKNNIIILVSSFFLIKGKFILSLFIKKIAILLPMGLSKRYLIEKVFLKNFKKHYLDKIPLFYFFLHIKKNFLNFSIVKKIIAFFSIGLFGFLTARFFGFLIFIKVTLAKIWSVLLFATLKIWGALFYFFSQYLWNSWLTPILEVFIFSWIIKLLERNRWIETKLFVVYNFIGKLFYFIELLLEKVFHIPLQKILNKLSLETSYAMHSFIGTKEHDRLYDAILEKNRKNGFLYKKMVNSTYISYHSLLNSNRQSLYMKSKQSKKSMYSQYINKKRKYSTKRFYLFLNIYRK